MMSDLPEYCGFRDIKPHTTPSPDVEALAEAWLADMAQSRHGEHPNDVSAYDADQMIDAYMAGHEAALAALTPAQDDGLDIERLQLERLNFKKWWGQERARNEKLQNENTALRASNHNALLKLGDVVQFGAHVPDSELWNRDGPYYVVSMEAQLRRGINIGVCPKYPWEPNKSEGITDGFYINKPNGSPDDVVLRIDQDLAKDSVKGTGDVD